MTWALFEEIDVTKEPINVGYEGDDAGMVMLELMRDRPTIVSDDFLHWINGRSRFAWKIISGFFDPSANDALKEAYLAFVARLAESTGSYAIIGTPLIIMEVIE